MILNVFRRMIRDVWCGPTVTTKLNIQTLRSFCFSVRWEENTSERDSIVQISYFQRLFQLFSKSINISMEQKDQKCALNIVLSSVNNINKLNIHGGPLLILDSCWSVVCLRWFAEFRCPVANQLRSEQQRSKYERFIGFWKTCFRYKIPEDISGRLTRLHPTPSSTLYTRFPLKLNNLNDEIQKKNPKSGINCTMRFSQKLYIILLLAFCVLGSFKISISLYKGTVSVNCNQKKKNWQGYEFAVRSRRRLKLWAEMSSDEDVVKSCLWQPQLVRWLTVRRSRPMTKSCCCCCYPVALPFACCKRKSEF